LHFCRGDAMSSESAVNHALIIAAGRGSRFNSGTAVTPKPLIEVNGTPLILHVLEAAGAAGINEATVVTGYLGDVLEDFLSGRPPGRMAVRCIRNTEWERPNGISVFKARGLMPQTFALLMSDHLIDPRIIRELAFNPINNGFCRLAVDFNPFGVPDLEDATKVMAANGRVLDIGKKISRYNGIDTGVFLCTEGIFHGLETSISRGEESLSDAVRVLARKGKMEVVDIGRLFWRDVDDETARRDAECILKNKFPNGWAFEL